MAAARLPAHLVEAAQRELGAVVVGHKHSDALLLLGVRAQGDLRPGSLVSACSIPTAARPTRLHRSSRALRLRKQPGRARA